ncbi:class II aldolase/adducin family protein [Sphingomonas sp. AOB5]|uniref:class II aldolase/adducin family protein n=1 Tax=Sphingomonas sp. AOB5 TaxID=3034017 RepID=UPI0023F64C7B|nr:class II aldolase/adducin family protein [Sphingomonas sp. AOB5]MDF7776466.1 class II aldolase/adducin family protein [Sphingomonas sp. AOB5]
MSERDPRLEIARASRILFGLGVVDAFGHVSMRHAERPDRFWMSRSMAPGQVMPEDVIEHDLDGEPVSVPGTRVFLERFIHAELYRARPDIGAVAHSHAPSVLPFTVVDVPVQPVAHTCGFLHGTGPAFDLADEAGDGTDLLIRNADFGRAFARHLGEANVALMRSHGFTTVGTTLAQAVFRAAYTAYNCQLQMAALQLGEPRYLSAAEAAACDASTNGQVDRAWNLWVSQHADF